MHLNKRVKNKDYMLGLCLKKDWIDSSKIFPGYINLDSDQGTVEPDINTACELRRLDEDYQKKLELLKAASTTLPKELDAIDENGKVNFELLSNKTH